MEVFPVTDSTLSADALNKLVHEKYNLGVDFSCSLFRTGINDTYFLTNSSVKYVARIYSYKWRTKAAILEEIELLNQLKDKGLSVSYPIQDSKGSYLQSLNAPEGVRFMVIFSYAEGKKVRFLTNEMCAIIGTFMAKMHKCTSKQNIERVNYTQDIILRNPYEFATRYFSESLDEMKYLKRLINELNTSFLNGNAASWQKGIIHMDIWYDNFNVDSKGEITVFDFDFCGTGWFVLDVAYFCSQLFHIETDKKQYDKKRTIFLEAYQRVLPLSKQEIQGIPSAGAAAWIFYLGVQSQRFDWSNIFLSENYLKMFVSRIKSWLDYTK